MEWQVFAICKFCVINKCFIKITQARIINTIHDEIPLMAETNLPGSNDSMVFIWTANQSNNIYI